MAKKEDIDISLVNLRKSATTKDRLIMADVIAKWYKGNILWLINEVQVATQLFWVSDLAQSSMGEVNGGTWGTGVRQSIA